MEVEAEAGAWVTTYTLAFTECARYIKQPEKGAYISPENGISSIYCWSEAEGNYGTGKVPKSNP